MAKIRRSGQQISASIWPGFVDAMTALLLVLMFVLTIFMIVQFVLRETISSQDTQLNYLSQQVASLAVALGLEQQKTDGLETEVARLDTALVEERSRAEIQVALIATLSRQTENQAAVIDAFETQVSSFEAQVASLLAEGAQLRLDKAGLEGELAAGAAENATLVARISEAEAENLRVVSESEALSLALAAARDEMDQGVEAARLAAAKRTALEAMIAEINANLESQQKARLADQAAVLALQQRLENAQTALSEEEKTRLVEAAAAEALRQKLASANAELTAMTLALEAQRQQAEDTLTLLAAADAAKAELDGLLAAALLAQNNATNANLDAKAQITEVTTERDRLVDLIAALEAEKSALTGQLAQAEGEKADLDARLANVIAKLEATDTARDIAATEASSTRTALEKRLAEALAAKAEAERAATKTQDELKAELTAALAAKLAAQQDTSVILSKSEQRRILLAQANEKLQQTVARSAKAEREIALLNQQTAALRKQLNDLQALLDISNDRDTEAQVQIASLGANLNTALARVAAEQKRLAEEQRKRAELEEAERKRLEVETKNLERFKSEFFGQMRDVLGNREGVRIDGDRFVFASEVLFTAGSATLSHEGEAEIAKVVRLILDVADQIPDSIDWILRVDGHTDNVPLSGNGEFKDNWELSQARALSVVRYMVNNLGMPPYRLAANGFGEFQPVNRDNTREARAQNRRIELKFTER